MSLSPELADIFREEARRALGREVSAATIGADIITVLSGMAPPDARVFVSRIHDAALEYLVTTDAGLNAAVAAGAESGVAEPAVAEPEPAPPSEPEPEPAPAPAVAEA
jgi:hypothetical protein